MTLAEWRKWSRRRSGLVGLSQKGTPAQSLSLSILRRGPGRTCLSQVSGLRTCCIYMLSPDTSRLHLKILLLSPFIPLTTDVNSFHIMGPVRREVYFPFTKKIPAYLLRISQVERKKISIVLENCM